MVPRDQVPLDHIVSGVADVNAELTVAPERVVQHPDVAGAAQEHPVAVVTAIAVTRVVAHHALRALHDPDADEAVA